MLVLGIETSCDETGIALYCSQRGLIADALYSQIQLHAEYGGVVPELASRDHVRKLLPLLDQMLAEHNIHLNEIDAIACTKGPGLIGALLVGTQAAQGLAWALDIPIIGIHHMEGHLLAPMLEDQPPAFPFVALLVSGGHSMLIDVAAPGDYQLLGEAFDKTAKLLGLGYPGGPALAICAENGDPDKFRFPRPMTDRPGLQMSFSGLKTHTRTLWLKHSSDLKPDQKQYQQLQADIAAGFQQAIAATLVIKCKRALTQTQRKTLIVAGGVSANTVLRQSLEENAQKIGYQVYYPRLSFCTDNGAMIAYAGAQRLLAGQTDTETINARPRWPLDSLSPICLNQ